MSECVNAWLQAEYGLVQDTFSCPYLIWRDFMGHCFLKGLFLVFMIPWSPGFLSSSHSSSVSLLSVVFPQCSILDLFFLYTSPKNPFLSWASLTQSFVTNNLSKASQPVDRKRPQLLILVNNIYCACIMFSSFEALETQNKSRSSELSQMKTHFGHVRLNQTARRWGFLTKRSQFHGLFIDCMKFCL